MVDGDDVSIGEGGEVGFGDKRCGERHAAVGFALGDGAEVAGERERTGQHAPEAHLAAGLGVVEAGDDAAVALVVGGIVARAAETVEPDAHHVEVVEAIDTGIHPEVAHLVDTAQHTGSAVVADPAFTRIGRGPPTAATGFSAPGPGAVGAPLTDVVAEGRTTGCGTGVVDLLHRLPHRFVARIGCSFTIAEVILEHIDTPTLEELHVGQFVAIAAGLIVFASHAAGIAVDAHLGRGIDGLQGCLEPADAFRELDGVVGEFGFVGLLRPPSVVEDDGVVAGRKKTFVFHSLRDGHHLVVADGFGKPVPAKPSHHGRGRLQVAAHGEADGDAAHHTIGGSHLDVVDVFALLFGRRAVDVLVAVAHSRTVVFEAETGERTEVDTLHGLARIGHKLMHKFCSGKTEQRGGAGQRTHRGVDDGPCAVAVVGAPEVEHGLVVHPAGEVPRRGIFLHLRHTAGDDAHVLPVGPQEDFPRFGRRGRGDHLHIAA